MLSSSTYIYKTVQNLVISQAFEGQRLDNFLMNHLKKVPRTRVYRMLRKGEVRINGRRVKPHDRLKEGDKLRIPPLYTCLEAPPILFSSSDNLVESLEKSILYEDKDLLILNKPTGIAVHGGSGLRFGVIEALRHLRGPSVSLELVHRLDRDTSGCLMVAKRRSSLKVLHEALREGRVQKSYLALVQGVWTGHTHIDEPLQRYHLSSGERRVKVAKEGKPSFTEVQLLKNYGDISLILAKPKTGRTHQIRVHLAFIGNPVIGDIKYGDKALNAALQARGFSRMFLHARGLVFRLPGATKAIEVQAPWDQAWESFLATL